MAQNIYNEIQTEDSEGNTDTFEFYIKSNNDLGDI